MGALMLSPSCGPRVLCLLLLLAMTGRVAAATEPEAAGVGTPDPEALLQRLNDYPHAEPVASSESEVIDYEFGLGAIRKVQGAWRFKDSERLSGTLLTYTWQIVDGFTSLEVAEELGELVDPGEGTELLFACEGRSCGPGVQWANRVFHQRILYGREELQRYRVYALGAAGEYRLVIYNSARSADRQYLHVELLRRTGGSGPEL